MAYKQLRDADMNTGYDGGWCLKFVQDAYKTNHPYPTAIAAWNAEPNKHYDLPPVGKTVPVYFSLGTEPAGHVAISLDDGKVASSTQGGKHSRPFFHPNLQDMINTYAKYNGGCKYLGWGEYVGTTKVIQGGDMITTKEQLDRLYLAVLTRPRGAGEGEDVYLNKDSGWVFDDLYNAKERSVRLQAVQEEKANTTKTVADLTATVTDLTAKLDEANNKHPVVQDSLANDTNLMVKSIKETMERIFK